MLKNLKIGPRLLLLVALLILFMVLIGVIGLRGIQATSAGLDTVYNDRVVPLRQLSLIADLYTRKITDTAFQARDGALTSSGAIKAIDAVLTSIRKEWQAYLSTFLVEDEQALVRQINPLMVVADQSIDRLRTFLESGQTEEIATFITTTLQPSLNAIDPKLAALSDVQIRVAQEEYNTNHERYQRTYFSMMALLAVAIALAIVFSFAIIRSITRPLTHLRALFDQLADGNLKAEIIHDGRQDEIGLMTQAILRHLNALKLAGADRRTLIDGTKSGMLTVRVDPARHRGDFATLAQGDNDLVETLTIPLFEVASVMAKLASGDVRGRMSGAYNGDLRALKGNVNRSLEGLAALLTEISDFANALANGDIRRSLEGAYQGDFAAIKVNINRAMEQLRDVIGTVIHAAQQVAHSAAETRAAANDVSRQVTNQTITLSDVSLAIEQTAVAVADIANRVERGSMLARDTATAAEDGQTKLGHLTNAVERIHTGNARIGQISSLIASIADKTYVLALNAGLEAIRAGDQGRGFGLIAHQITQLSEEVSHATRDIRSLIEDAINHVQTGVNAAQAANSAITQIVASAHESDATIQAIAAAVEEQSATTQDLKEQVNRLHATGESTAAAAEEISSTMAALDEMARNLKTESERIRIA
ncbi:methyl-accepting chemotaxis protein [Gammaproteobacteria bacterium]